MILQKTTIKDLVQAVTTHATEFLYIPNGHRLSIDVFKSLTLSDLKRFYVSTRKQGVKHSNFLEFENGSRLYLNDLKVFKDKNLYVIVDEFHFLAYKTI